MQPDQTAAPIEVLLYTVPQVAKILQVSERTVHNLIYRGQLAPVYLGKSLRIFSDDLEQLARTGTRPNHAGVLVESLSDTGLVQAQ
jgi:excisionase family DNA binding protein